MYEHAPEYTSHAQTVPQSRFTRQVYTIVYDHSIYCTAADVAHSVGLDAKVYVVFVERVSASLWHYAPLPAAKVGQNAPVSSLSLAS